MDARRVTTVALAGRAAFGVASLVAPDTAWRGFGVRVPAGNGRYVGRMFGVRDIALGAAGLLVTGKARRTVLLVAAAADVLDAGVAVVAHKQGDLSKLAAAVLLAGGAAFLAGDALELVAGGPVD
jgi:hypothetical protein